MLLHYWQCTRLYVSHCIFWTPIYFAFLFYFVNDTFFNFGKSHQNMRPQVTWRPLFMFKQISILMIPQGPDKWQGTIWFSNFIEFSSFVVCNSSYATTVITLILSNVELRMYGVKNVELRMDEIEKWTKDNTWRISCMICLIACLFGIIG